MDASTLTTPRAHPVHGEWLSGVARADLKGPTKAFAFALVAYVDLRSSTVRASMATLASAAGISERAARREIGALEAVGVVVISSRGSHSRGRLISLRLDALRALSPRDGGGQRGRDEKLIPATQAGMEVDPGQRGRDEGLIPATQAAIQGRQSRTNTIKGAERGVGGGDELEGLNGRASVVVEMLGERPAWLEHGERWIDPRTARELARPDTVTIDVVRWALAEAWSARRTLHNPAGFVIGKVREPDFGAVYRLAEQRRKLGKQRDAQANRIDRESRERNEAEKRAQASRESDEARWAGLDPSTRFAALEAIQADDSLGLFRGKSIAQLEASRFARADALKLIDSGKVAV